jgi:hypothetical protein
LRGRAAEAQAFGAFGLYHSMSLPFLKNLMLWGSQLGAVSSLTIIVYVKSKFIFDSCNEPGLLIFCAMVTSGLTFILSIVSLPRWQAIISLVIIGYIAYQLLFNQLYVPS